MTKKPSIRKDEKELSYKEMLRRWLYGEPCLDKVEEDQPADEEQTVDVQSADATGDATGGTDPLLQNVMVLELVPFSKANKANQARNSVVWNQLWGLVRKLEGLPADTTKTMKFSLTTTAKLLDVDPDTLSRYVWGYASRTKGRPITKDAAANTESILAMVFQTVAPPLAAATVYEKASAAAGAIGSKAAAVPLHTCKTQYGLAAIYDLGVEDDSLGPEWKWKRKVKHSKSVEFQLLPQMRGRHILGASSRRHHGVVTHRESGPCA